MVKTRDIFFQATRKNQMRMIHTTAPPLQNHHAFQTGRGSVKLYQLKSSASLPMNHSTQALVMEQARILPVSCRKEKAGQRVFSQEFSPDR